jgi:hypothetical protein
MNRRGSGYGSDSNPYTNVNASSKRRGSGYSSDDNPYHNASTNTNANAKMRGSGYDSDGSASKPINKGRLSIDIYLCTYICIFISIYIYMCVYIHGNIGLYMYTYIYILYICMHMNVSMNMIV